MKGHVIISSEQIFLSLSLLLTKKKYKFRFVEGTLEMRLDVASETIIILSILNEG